MIEKLQARAAQDMHKRPSLVEDAYRALKEAIRDNVFPPGYQGSEQEMAMRLGMSRTPVHEAIIRLQEDGLVRVLSKRGVMVCPLAPEDVREIYEVIIAIESMAAELLAARSQEERRLVANELKRPLREWRRLSEKTISSPGLPRTTCSIERWSSAAATGASEELLRPSPIKLIGLACSPSSFAPSQPDRSRRTDGSSLPFRRDEWRRPIAMRGNIASAPAMNSFR